jgi:hypothetical protein
MAMQTAWCGTVRLVRFSQRQPRPAITSYRALEHVCSLGRLKETKSRSRLGSALHVRNLDFCFALGTKTVRFNIAGYLACSFVVAL